MTLNVTRSRRWHLRETTSWRVDGVMTRRWRHGGYALRHDAVDAGRAEAERACHAIAATRGEETERRETQGWRDAPDGAELFAEGSDARNEVKRLEAGLQTTEFRVKVDDERSRRGVRDCAFDRGGGAAMAPRGARPPPSRHRAGVASMAWRS